MTRNEIPGQKVVTWPRNTKLAKSLPPAILYYSIGTSKVDAGKRE